MGGKVSKQDHVIEQRFNYLKSMASDVSDFINNYEGDNGENFSIRKLPVYGESVRLDKSGARLGLPLSHKKKTSIAVRDSDAVSIGEYNQDSERDFDYYARAAHGRAPVKKNSGRLQLSLAGDYMNFNLDPLTPTTFMKQAKAKMDEEMKGTLQGLIKRSYTSLTSTKVYLYTEIPLEDEKTMEEKSCKVVDRSRNQGYDDYESPITKHNIDGEEAYDEYENSKLRFYEMGIAVACRKGEAPDVPNQDNYFIYVDAYTKVYTVYDGHGPFGNLVSHFVCIHVAKALLEEPIYLVDPVGAIKQALIKAEASLLAHTQKKVNIICRTYYLYCYTGYTI